MKKAITGSVVRALIFHWQFLSFALFNFHKPAQQYTDKQDAIMSFLVSQELNDSKMSTSSFQTIVIAALAVDVMAFLKNPIPVLFGIKHLIYGPICLMPFLRGD